MLCSKNKLSDAAEAWKTNVYFTTCGGTCAPAVANACRSMLWTVHPIRNLTFVVVMPSAVAFTELVVASIDIVYLEPTKRFEMVTGDSSDATVRATLSTHWPPTVVAPGSCCHFASVIHRQYLFTAPFTVDDIAAVHSVSSVCSPEHVSESGSHEHLDTELEHSWRVASQLHAWVLLGFVQANSAL